MQSSQYKKESLKRKRSTRRKGNRSPYFVDSSPESDDEATEEKVAKKRKYDLSIAEHDVDDNENVPDSFPYGIICAIQLLLLSLDSRTSWVEVMLNTKWVPLHIPSISVNQPSLCEKYSPHQIIYAVGFEKS